MQGRGLVAAGTAPSHRSPWHWGSGRQQPQPLAPLGISAKEFFRYGENKCVHSHAGIRWGNCARNLSVASNCNAQGHLLSYSKHVGTCIALSKCSSSLSQGGLKVRTSSSLPHPPVAPRMITEFPQPNLCTVFFFHIYFLWTSPPLCCLPLHLLHLSLRKCGVFHVEV